MAVVRPLLCFESWVTAPHETLAQSGTTADSAGVGTTERPAALWLALKLVQRLWQPVLVAAWVQSA